MNPTPTKPAMTDNILFEHFTTLATAPDGIARLRELILKLAVRGKLGTQDVGDEPASVLLVKIKREKERLVKEGKIRNEKPLDPVTASIIPHQIPKTWIWTRIGQIGQIVGGSTPRTTNPEYYENNGIPWLTPADLYGLKAKYIGRGRKDISKAGLKESSAQLLPKGSILFSSRAPIGYVAIASNPVTTNQGFKSCIPYIGEMSESIYYFLISAAKEIDAKASGTTFKEVSGQEVKHILFPLPPLAEQHRIVAKVDRLMALCDELEARQQQERAGCLRLGTASLAGLQNADSPEEFGRQWAQVCDAFDLILDCPENVAVLRQTILQLAVQGRLVKQESKDKIASFSLKEQVDNKLAKELKIFFSKPHKNLEDFFIFPKNWVFTSLINVTNIVDTQPNHRTPAAVENGVPYIGMKDIQSDGTINFKNARKISNDVCQEHRNRYTLSKGDFIIGKIGTIGNPIRLRPPFDYTLSANILLIQPDPKYVSPDFIYYLFKSPMIETKLQDESSFSTSQPLYGIKKLRALRIPLPPLAEQHRIVAKVDALMALCDALESRLKEQAGVQGRLANAIVKNVADA